MSCSSASSGISTPGNLRELPHRHGVDHLQHVRVRLGGGLLLGGGVRHHALHERGSDDGVAEPLLDGRLEAERLGPVDVALEHEFATLDDVGGRSTELDRVRAGLHPPAVARDIPEREGATVERDLDDGCLAGREVHLGEALQLPDRPAHRRRRRVRRRPARPRRPPRAPVLLTVTVTRRRRRRPVDCDLEGDSCANVV